MTDRFKAFNQLSGNTDMATTRVEQPSEAERFEAEAEAGAGADDTTLRGDNGDLEHGDGKFVSPSDSSEAVAVPEKEKVVDEKERSKGKTALLMGALCVCTIEPPAGRTTIQNC